MTIYDVAIITVRPGRHPAALGRLERSLAAAVPAGRLLACWYSDLGAINQVLLIHAHEDETALMAQRAAIVQSRDPLGIGELIVAMTMDTYLSFPFIQPLIPGKHGPFYEVRTYMLKPDALAATIELWRKAVPGRAVVSPLVAAMYAVSGPAIRFMHIWPYASLDERLRLRAKAVADGVWPPAGGPDLLAAQQADIYLPADFSPMH
jgi:NIPSNAP